MDDVIICSGYVGIRSGGGGCSGGIEVEVVEVRKGVA